MVGEVIEIAVDTEAVVVAETGTLTEEVAVVVTVVSFTDGRRYRHTNGGTLLQICIGYVDIKYAYSRLELL